MYISEGMYSDLNVLINTASMKGMKIDMVQCIPIDSYGDPLKSYGA